MKKFLFKLCFSQRETDAIINALYRRANDTSTDHVKGDKWIRDFCLSLANKLFQL